MRCHRVTEPHGGHDRSCGGRRAPLYHAPRLSVCLYLLLATAVAHAQSADPEANDGLAAGSDAASGTLSRPWVQGVPIEVRVEANRIFLEGNELMREGLFVQAAEKYRAALALWDHPGFHYNLAIAQINLDQPIAAYESLQRAVRHGAAPFGEDKLEQAESFLTLLRNQLAHVEVACDEPGAVVTLDGKLLFTAPGRVQIVTLPGGHQLMADQPGRLPDTRQIVLAPGQRARFSLAPRIPDQLVTERRWPAWRPWAVTAAGLAVVAGGAALEWRAGVLFARHDAEAGRLCLGQAGCAAEAIPAGLHRQLERAERWQRGAHAVYAVGGVALASGVVLLYLNRDRPVRRRGRLEAPRVSLSPVLAPQVVGLSVSVDF